MGQPLDGTAFAVTSGVGHRRFAENHRWSACRRRHATCSAEGNGVPYPAVANGTHFPFTLLKTVQPADTDYSGALWHGCYVRYLEEARVGWLAENGVDYAELVRVQETELVVAEMNVKYKAPARMGDNVRVTVEPGPMRGVRMPLHSVMSMEHKVLAEAVVTLAPVSIRTGKLCRKIPDVVRHLMPRDVSTGR